MSDIPQPPASGQNTNSTPVITTQEHADTHRSLQQASVALELASNRIRQVRRSLIQLSESLPTHDNNIARLAALSDLRPPHEALLLTNADGVPRPTSVRISAERRRARNLPTVHVAPEQTATDAQLGEPPANQALGANARRQEILQGMYPIGDPGATTRGLRVAARQAMLRSSREGVVGDGPTRIPAPAGVPVGAMESPVNATENLYSHFDATLRNMQARYEQLEHRARLVRMYADMDLVEDSLSAPPFPPLAERLNHRWVPPTPLASNTSPTTASPPAQDPLVTPVRSLSINGGRWGPRPVPPTPNDSTLPGILPDLPIIPGDSEWVGGGSVEQHYLLFNDLYMASYPRFMAETSTYGDESHWQVPGREVPRDRLRPTDAIRRPEQTDAVRSRVVRGEPLNDGQGAQPLPPTTTSERVVSPPEVRSSRRAWARLDADGDEIPPNEEEELERQRTLYRLRAQQRARQHIPPGQVDVTRSFARLGFDGPREMQGSVIDSARTVPDVRRQLPSLPAYTPVSAEVKDSYVDPLPMPLESMVMTSVTRKEEDMYIDIVFPKHACVAGR